MFSSALASQSSQGLYQTTDDVVADPVAPVFRTAVVSDTLLTSLEANGKRPERKIWDANLNKAGVEGFRLRTAALSDPEAARQAKLERKKTRDKFMGKSKSSVEEQSTSAANATAIGTSLPDATNLGGTSAANATAIGTSLPDATNLGGLKTTDSAPGGNLTRGLMASSSAPALGSTSTPDQTQPVMATQEKPMTRAQKYYQTLLKHEYMRNERIRKDKETEKLTKAEKAAANAQKLAVEAEKSEHSSKSESEVDEEEEEEEEEETGPLVPYDGALRVEFEVVVMRAPGAEKSDQHSDSLTNGSTATPASSAASSVIEEDERIDLSKELQALQEQFAEPEVEESEGSDGLPEGLRMRQVAGINDMDDRRVALGLGGTAFFVPDVERYALAPSLLPPPPQSLAGRRRLRLKPRLPLEISRHRWRDEHPYVGAPPAYSPDQDERRSYEDKMCMVDLYAGVSQVMTRIPKPDGIRRPAPPKLFDMMLDKEMRNSQAWRQHIKRERILFLQTQAKDKAAEEARKAEEELLLGRPASGSATPATPGAHSAASGSRRRGSGPPSPPQGRARGSNPPSPPEAGGGGGLMGVAPNVRAGI